MTTTPTPEHRIAFTSCIHADKQNRIDENLSVLAEVVEGAIAHEVSAFVLLGDDFDRGNPSSNALFRMAATLSPLCAAGIPVVFVQGNHALLGHRRGERTASVVLASMLPGEVCLADDRPALFSTSTGVQFACLPWVEPDVQARELGMADAELADQEAAVAQWMVSRMEAMVAAADRSKPLVIASHLNATTLGRGVHIDPASLSNLTGEGKACAVALGHIHTPFDVAKGVFYAGSPQRHDFSDEGRETTWSLLTISGGKAGLTRVPVSRSRQFITLDADSSRFDVPAGAVVRVQLTPNNPTIPEAALDAVEAAGARMVRPLASPLASSLATSSSKAVVSPSTAPDEALVQWLGATHPGSDHDAILTLSKEF